MKMPPLLHSRTKFVLALLIVAGAIIWTGRAHLRPALPDGPEAWPEATAQRHMSAYTNAQGVPEGWRLINFWATWCPPCIEELPELEAMQALLPDVEIVTVAADQAPERLALFWRDEQYTLPGFIDSNTVIAKELNIVGYPYTYLVSPENDIMQVFIGRQPWLTEDVLETVRQRMHDDGKGITL